jgi:hypothetical protein
MILVAARVATLVVAVAAVATLPGRAVGKATDSVPPSFGGCLKQPVVSPVLQPDLALVDQPDANCFAWQEFIALNWRAAPGQCGVPDPNIPASQFGAPKDTTPVVWETYSEASQVFKKGAAAPDPWCAAQSLPASIGHAGELKPTSGHGYKTLVEDSKFEGARLSIFHQASPDDAWLTAQNGHLTMYEIRLNKAEFDYIDQNRLYNADVQQQFVTTEGIQLRYGSIEIKAAWLELDDPSLYPQYKISDAIVKYPNDPTPHQVVVGLVGLHIIQKTPRAEQFVWATFEHVGLDPTTADVNGNDLTPPYTYYSTTCNKNTDPYKCADNTPPKPGDPYGAPLQVSRGRPITSSQSDNVVGLNEAVWNLIGQSNPNSVFLNYQLVDVLWPNSSTKIPTGAKTPLTQGNPQPIPTSPVVNTTLETYVQGDTCLFCHASAPIANPKAGALVRILKPLRRGLGAAPKDSASAYASDYSFLFMKAQSPPPSSDSSALWAALGVVLAVGGGVAAVVWVRGRRTPRTE